MEALDRPLNAFITATPESALKAAEAADAALARGDAGPLAGIPLGIKDLFCTAGVRTTAASRILAPFVPPYESTVTANLLRDGAVFLGKTNLDEFAMGSSNMSSAFGPVTNPWSPPDASAGARRLVRRLGRGGGGRAGDGRHRDRHRRLDPAAGTLVRHRGDQADLRPLQPLGRGGVRVLARPPGPFGALGGRCARRCCSPWPGSTRRTAPRPTAPCRTSPPPAAAA